MKHKIKKLKKKSKKIKKKILGHIHNTYFFIKKLPRPVKYGTAGSLVVLWILFLANPFLPGWLLLGVGLGVFSPHLYKKLIWKHVRTENFDVIVKEHMEKIKYILTENGKEYLKFYEKVLLKKNISKKKFSKLHFGRTTRRIKKHLEEKVQSELNDIVWE